MSATPVFDFAGVFADEPLFTTGYKVGGGYDKNPPPCRELWMTGPLWTIAEHLYYIEATRPNMRTKMSSSQARRHPIGVRLNDSSPDSSGINTVRNRLIDGPITEGRKRLVGRDAPRISRAECLLEAGPEFRQPHRTSLPRRASEAGACPLILDT
jgi:hypothetical protein